MEVALSSMYSITKFAIVALMEDPMAQHSSSGQTLVTSWCSLHKYLYMPNKKLCIQNQMLALRHGLYR